MVVIKLMGGMGNQMFQYAFARKISLIDKRELKIDLSFLKKRDIAPGFVYRNYDLDLFNIKEIFFDGVTNSSYMKVNEIGSLYNDKLSNCYLNITKDKNIYLEGYWQCIKYFDQIQDTIREEFKLKKDISEKSKALLDEIKSKNSVLINIRRTDYLNTSFHGVMGVEYINKAKQLVENKIKDPFYYIFSDDVDWCKNNLKIDNSYIVSHEYAGDRFGEYLELMKNCKHFIIPNSSFAWWAAWLSENKSKIIIYPKQWFSYVPSSITSYLDWIGI